MRALAIPPQSRRLVRRLHLRATRDEDVSRTATLLADALSTASWPVADQGKLLVIRRLALGRISSAASPASLALQIERVAREVMNQAVWCDRPEAHDADAVVFASRGEAIIALARRHARRAATDAWFWPSLVPGWRTDIGDANRWRLLIEAAHTTNESAVVAAAVVDQAVEADVVHAALAAVTPRDAMRWMQHEGWTAGEPGPPIAMPRLASRRATMVNRLRASWGIDERLVWLTTMFVIAEQPGRAGDSRLPSAVVAALQSTGIARVDSVGADDSEPAPASAVDGPSPAEPRRSALRARRPNSLPPTRVERAEDAQAIEHEGRVAATSNSPFESHTEPRLFTSHGGLLFVVPILERLDFPAHVASNPDLLDAEYPMRVLRFIGRRAGLASDDPLALALAPHHSDDERHDADESVARWMNAVRRWSRRHARMGLVTLIRRPARVFVSRTHIEIAFTLSQVDVRLRRVAIDVDPGWVPWLGRVVTFSYVDRHDETR